MRKNMKIPRKKEKSEQPVEPVIILRIIRLPSMFLNPLEAVKQKEWKEVVMKNNVCEKL
jgi:hypothetical protein